MGLTVTKPKLTEYQKRIIYSPARFTVTEASTKAGKTFSHLWWLFEIAHKNEKKGANYWWIAPVFSQARIAFTRLKRVIVTSGAYRFNEGSMTIQTPTGSIIWFKSADNPDNLYGEDVYGAVFDEFTRAKEEAWIALRTTVSATRGPVKFIGNTKGKKNWGYKLGLKARSGEQGYEYFKVTAWDAVDAGILDREEVEQAKRDLPDHAFRELYLAEALDDKANPFGLDFLRNAKRPLSTGNAVAFGVDVARSVDWTVIVGLDADGVPCHYERFQADWGQTTQRIITAIKQVPTFIDATGVGSPIVETIARTCRKAEGFVFGARNKQSIMEGLAAGIQSGKCFITEPMIDEFESFEFEYHRTGVTYKAPDGLHDDIVCAMALAHDKRMEKRPAQVYFPSIHRAR